MTLRARKLSQGYYRANGAPDMENARFFVWNRGRRTSQC